VAVLGDESARQLPKLRVAKLKATTLRKPKTDHLERVLAAMQLAERVLAAMQLSLPLKR